MKYELKYEHVLAEVLQSPWAILPEKLHAIAGVLSFRAAGNRLTEQEITERIGATRTDREPYVVGAQARAAGKPASSAKGIAVLPVYGVIGPKASAFERASSGGGTGIDALTQAFRAALASADIGTIVFDFDSPGGSVFGVAELADEIYAARGQKKIVAQVAPLAASAAYWLACSCSEIVMTQSGQAGSIGVFTAHTDMSAALATEGLKVTLVSAGKFKTEGDPSQPLSDEAKAAIQNRVDQYYSAFVAGVARGRAVTQANVRTGFGEGRVVSAADALAMNMADRIATLDQTIEQLLGGRAATRTEVPRSESSVQVPAASAVEIPATAETKKESIMEQPTPAVGAAELNVIREGVIQAEQLRVQGITQLARHTGMTDKAAGWIREGKTIDAVSNEITEQLAKTAKPGPSVPAPGEQVQLSAKEQGEYSILRGMRGLLARNGSRDFSGQEASLEFEISDTIAKKLGRSTAGIFMPTNLKMHGDRLRAQRAIEQFNAVLVGGSSPGSNLVQTTVMPDEFIQLLRNMMVVDKLGARRLSGLVGNPALPAQTGAATLQWTGENPGSAVTASDQNYSQVTPTPKTALAQTVISRQWLMQSSMDAEQLTREDLAAIFAVGVDLAAMVGTGASNQPKGIVNQTGVNTIAIGTNGGAITYNILVDAQTALETNNVPLSSLGIVTTPGVKAKLRKTAKLANTIAGAIWGDDQTVAGWPAFATNQLPANATKGTGTNLATLIAGAWNQLIIAEWGAMELIADPYTQAGKNNIVLTGSMLIDVAVRYAKAFTYINDIDPLQ